MFRCVMIQSARVGHSLEATHGVGCSGVGALEFRPPVGLFSRYLSGVLSISYIV